MTRLTAIGGALVLLAVAACGGADGLDGTVRVADTKGGGDRALSGGWVAVMTADQADALWAGAGADPPTAADLPYLNTRVRHEDVTALGGLLVAVDDKGGFTTTARGRRVLCLVRPVPQQPDLLRGCASVTLPESGTVEVTVGAGGTHAKVDG